VVVASDQPTLPVSAAALTDGTQLSIVRGGAKGVTPASTLTSTAQGADHQALDVQLHTMETRQLILEVFVPLQ
jgi:hypothetical protein